MQPCLTKTQQTLAALLEALEAEARKSAPQDDDHRSEWRRPLHAEAELCVFKATGEPVIIPDAFARNLTFMGLSVVADLPQPVAPGRPVETVVWTKDYARTHIAGTAAFCRPVEDECYEVGISIQAAGSAPILINDLANARKIYDWFAEALNVPA